MKHRFPALFAIAQDALSANIIKIENDTFALRAGGHQFQSLWTRDFCFSASGLLKMGLQNVVKNHLEVILKNVRQDGLVPRSLDRMRTTWRVLVYSIFGIILPPPRAPLRAEYTGEHGTIARDSNPLVLLTAIAYVESTGDLDFWHKHLSLYQKMYDCFVSASDVDGLVAQGRYEDWQDSVNRSGKSFYLNLLHWRLINQIEKFQLGIRCPITSELIKSKLVQVFYDSQSGVFLSLKDRRDHTSLDGNLLALKWNLLGRSNSPEWRSLYRALKRHPLFHGELGPGFCSFPSYSSSEVSWTTRVVGLGEYHGAYYWSWLMGLTAEVARQAGDQKLSASIFEILTQISFPQNTIHEIYDSKARPVRNLLYRSEQPFSWGAACIIDGLI